MDRFAQIRMGRDTLYVTGHANEEVFMKLALVVTGGLGILALALIMGCGQKAEKEETFQMELSPGKVPGPSQLLTEAQKTHTPEEKLKLFHLIVSTYPDSPQADDAQFMIGFVYNEDLAMPEEARKAFDILGEQYPESEWLDDAASLMTIDQQQSE